MSHGCNRFPYPTPAPAPSLSISTYSMPSPLFLFTTFQHPMALSLYLCIYLEEFTRKYHFRWPLIKKSPSSSYKTKPVFSPKFSSFFFLSLFNECRCRSFCPGLEFSLTSLYYVEQRRCRLFLASIRFYKLLARLNSKI